MAIVVVERCGKKGATRVASYFHISDNLYIRFDNNDKKGLREPVAKFDIILWNALTSRRWAFGGLIGLSVPLNYEYMSLDCVTFNLKSSG